MTCPPASDYAGRILAAFTDEAALIRVTGRGTFRSAPAFRQAIRAAMDAQVPLILVDMAECPSLDSTFMGAIAAIGLEERRTKQYRTILINVSEALRALLKSLGITRIVRLFPADALPPEVTNLSGLAADLQPVDAPSSSTHETAMMMYDAHETLARVQPGNLAKFKHVLGCLRADIEQFQKDASGGNP